MYVWQGLIGTAARDSIYVAGMLAVSTTIFTYIHLDKRCVSHALFQVTPRMQRYLSDKNGLAMSDASSSLCASAIG